MPIVMPLSIDRITTHCLQRGDVERIEDSVFKNIDRVEFLGGTKLSPFTPDIADFHGDVLDQLVLERQVPVLHVGNDTVVGESLQPRNAVGDRDRLQRPDAALGQRKRCQRRRDV